MHVLLLAGNTQFLHLILYLEHWWTCHVFEIIEKCCEDDVYCGRSVPGSCCPALIGALSQDNSGIAASLWEYLICSPVRFLLPCTFFTKFSPITMDTWARFLEILNAGLNEFGKLTVLGKNAETDGRLRSYVWLKLPERYPENKEVIPLKKKLKSRFSTLKQTLNFSFWQGFWD